MPADLPPQSGYTYAVDLSTDEAPDAEVTFDRPLFFYVENFLGFPVGGTVPVGSYDRERSVWRAAPNGRVVRVLATSGGAATVDTDGDGQPDDGTPALSQEERRLLAALYGPGQELWRVPIAHFSPWDCNWPYGPPPDAVGPAGDPSGSPETDDGPCGSGSLIDCQNQALGETLAPAGVPFRLAYRSDRAPGHRAPYTLQIPISGAKLPTSLREIRLEVEVAGQKTTRLFAPAAALTTTYTWDGKDAYGRTLRGQQPITVRIAYRYPAVYLRPAELAASFALVSSGAIARDVARQEVWLQREWRGRIGGHLADAAALGGWYPDVMHAYDPGGQVLYLGDGRRRSADAQPANVVTRAGGGPSMQRRDGVPATESQLDPLDVEVAPDGSIYVVDPYTIRRIGPDGIITTVAGSLSAFCVTATDPCGDGGPALQARLHTPSSIALAPDGSVYTTSIYSHRVRRVTPDGLIDTVAGTGASCTAIPCGHGLPAKQASLDFPRDLVFAPDGSYYVYSQAPIGFNIIQRVGTDGVVSLVAGTAGRCTPPYSDCGVGGPATRAALGPISALMLDRDGSLLVGIADGGHVLRIGPSGTLSTLAGSGGPGPAGDGGPATEARFGHILGLARDPGGRLLISDRNEDPDAAKIQQRVRMIGQDGFISTVAGGGAQVWPADEGGLATQSRLASNPYLDTQAIAAAPNGALYFTVSQMLRKIAPALPGGQLATELTLSSEDGAWVYVFHPSGRHLRTVDAYTGAVVHRFGYDAQGRLASVTDRAGNTTLVERDAAGRAQALVGAYGHRTGIGLDENGYLARVTDPTGAAYTLEHTPDGLLTRLGDPRGGTARFSYDDVGRLIRDVNPAGGAITLASSAPAAGEYTITLTRPMGDTRQYHVQPHAGGRTEERIDPAGLKTALSFGADGSEVTHFPDGTEVRLVRGADPRFGPLTRLAAQTTRTTPGGRVRSQALTRTITLQRPADPLSLSALTDTLTVNGRTATLSYDGASRTFAWKTATGRLASLVLDALGRPVSARRGDLAAVLAEYDDHGRLHKVQQGERIYTLDYDAQGALSAVTDPLSRVVTLQRDRVGRATGLGLPGGRAVRLGYDATGDVISLTPPGRTAPHQFAYDTSGMLSRYTAPDAGGGPSETGFGYDLDRRLVRVTPPEGGAITLSHDASRPSRVVADGDDIRVTYDPRVGQIATVTSSAATLTYGWDGDLPVSVTSSGAVTGTVRYQYDSDLRVASQAVDGGASAALAYDQDGLLVGVGPLTLQRSATTGLLTDATLGVVRESFTYNSIGEVVGHAATAKGAGIYSLGLVRDDLGRVVQGSETIQGVRHDYAYSYDAAGRLAAVSRDGAPLSSYGYDANSNRTSYSGPLGAASGAYDARDRLTSYGLRTYQYTANGALREQRLGGQVTSYGWDGLGRLRSAALPSGKKVERRFDGLGRCVARLVDGVAVQGFLYGWGTHPLAELDGAGRVVSRFVSAGEDGAPSYLIQGGVTYRVVTDLAGSVRLVVDTTTGVVAQEVDYDEFGNVTKDTNPGFQPFGFAGGLYDRDTGLVQLGARTYDPVVGGFLSRDPIGFSGNSTNLYAYATGDPINRVDRQGAEALDLPQLRFYELQNLFHFGPELKFAPSLGPGPASPNAGTCADDLRKCGGTSFEKPGIEQQLKSVPPISYVIDHFHGFPGDAEKYGAPSAKGLCFQIQH